MTDDFMFCNYKQCMLPLTKAAWITRCSHVFCDDHGDRFFLTNATKIKCPACNEVNNKEVDVIKSKLNPSDMLICCVRPEKAVEYAAYAIRLWRYQMQIKRKYTVDMLTQKYERITMEGTSQLQAENRDLKKLSMEIEAKLNRVNEELAKTKQKLKQYKAAYETICATKKNGHLLKRVAANRGIFDIEMSSMLQGDFSENYNLLQRRKGFNESFSGIQRI